jgi:hypothetical protein
MTTAAQQNAFRDANRAKKVLDLSVAIDQALRDAKIDPHSQDAVAAVERLSVQGWLSAVKQTGREPRVPSETTKAQVLALYRRRAEQDEPECDDDFDPDFDLGFGPLPAEGE